MKAQLAGNTLLNETKVQILPNFPGAKKGREIALKSLSAERSEGLPMLVFEFESSAKMHYAKDSKRGLMRILVPNGSYRGADFKSNRASGPDSRSPPSILRATRFLKSPCPSVRTRWNS